MTAEPRKDSHGPGDVPPETDVLALPGPQPPPAAPLPGQSPAAPAGAGPRLTITVAGNARTLDPGEECVIGRGDDADVDVQAPLVSRRHAVVQHDDGRWCVRDLGSTNGIWHDGA